MTHISQVGIPLAIAAVVGGCGGSERTSQAGATTDSASLAASTAPVQRRVSAVMVGRRIGPGNRITEPTFQFTPRDTVYVSVGTEGNQGPTDLSAAWRSQSGEILEQSTAQARVGENTAFQLARPKGLKPGTYKVVLFLGGDSADTKVFVVGK